MPGILAAAAGHPKRAVTTLPEGAGDPLQRGYRDFGVRGGTSMERLVAPECTFLCWASAAERSVN
jgi:hypothetical protein